MQTRIPEMKTSIEGLQERLDDMFFKDATPTSIRSTVSGENYAMHGKTGDTGPKSLTSKGIRKNKDKLKTGTNYRDNLSQKREKKHIRFQTNAPSFNSSAGGKTNAGSHSKADAGKERSSGARDKMGFVKQSNTGLTNLHTITNSKITSTISEIDETIPVDARGFDHLEFNKNRKESKMEVITDPHMDSRFKKKVVYARSEIVESILVGPRMGNIESEDKSELHARVGKTPKANERISKESYLSKSSVSKETEDLLRLDSREAEEPSRFSNSGSPHHNTHATYSAITPVVRTDTIEKQIHSSNTPHTTKETYSVFTPVIRSDTLKSVSSSSKSPSHRSRRSPNLQSNLVYNPDIPKLSQKLSESDFVKASPELNRSKVKLGDRDIAYGKNAQSFSRSELELNHSKVKLGDRDIAYGKNAQSFSRSELELNHSKVKLGDRDIAYGKNAQSFSRSELELNHSKVKLGDRDIVDCKKPQSFSRSELELNHSKVKFGDRDIVDCKKPQSFSRSELELNHSKVKLGDRDIANGKNAQPFSRSDLELNHSKVELGDRDIAYGKKAQSFSRSELELNHSKVKLGDRDIANGKKAQSFSRSELELNHSKSKLGDRDIAYGKNAQSFSRSELELNHSKSKLGDRDIANGENAQSFSRSELELNHSKVKFRDKDITNGKKAQSFCRSELDLDTEDLYDSGSEYAKMGSIAGSGRQEKSHIVNVDKSGSDKYICFECGPICVCGQTVISSVNHIALSVAKTPRSFGHSEYNKVKDTSVLETENSIQTNKTCLGDWNSWGEAGEMQLPEMAQKPSKHTPQSFGHSKCKTFKDSSVLVPENSINSNKTCLGLGDRNSWGETGEVQVLEMVPKSSKHSVTSLSFCTSRLKEVPDKSASQLNTSAPPNLHIGLRGYVETPRGVSSSQCENDAVLDSGISNDTLDQSRSSEFSGSSLMDWLTLTKAKAKDEVSARKFDGLLRSEELLPEKLNYEMMGDCDDIDSVITISSTKTDGTCDVVSLSDSQLGCSYEDKVPKVTRHTPYVHVREKQQAIAASPKRVRFNLTS